MKKRQIDYVPELEAVKVAAPFHLWVRFSDGVEGEIDLSSDLKGPAFRELKDPEAFGQAFLDHDLGTVAWPNGADIAPETLYERALRRRVFA